MLSELKNKWAKTSDLNALFSRFPIVITALGIFAACISLRDGFPSDRVLFNLLVGLVIGLYLAVCETIIAERDGRRPRWVLQILLIVTLTTLGGFSQIFRINLWMATGAVLLVLGNSILFRRDKNNLRLWDFTHKIWTGAAFATLGSILYTFGLLAIFALLSTLFGLKIDAVLNYILLPLGLGFFAPLYWLSTVPNPDEDYQELYETPQFVSNSIAFIGTWILAPLTLIYAIILLSYGIKIALEGILPKGEIAELTLPFLLIGTLTFLLLTPPFIQQRRLARLFRRLWFPLSIPASLLLALSVGVRIEAYGLTPERIALAVAVFWSFFLGVWFTFKGAQETDIRIIPGLAAALLVFGAIFSGWMSVYSQTQRFESALRDAGILLPNGRLAKSVTDMNIDAARRAKGAVLYLFDAKGERYIQSVLKTSDIPIENSAEFMTALALSDIELNSRYKDDLSLSFRANLRQISVSGFDTVAIDILHRPRDLTFQDLRQLGPLVIKGNNNFIIGELNGEEQFRWDAQKAILGLLDERNQFPKEIDPITLYETQTHSVILILTDAIFRKNREDSKEAELEYMRFHLLTRGIE